MAIDYRNEMTKDAMGGTELMAMELEKRLEPELLEKFQIISSRVDKIDDTKKKVLWLHDLPGDPASEHLLNGGYNRFDKLVFVSNWQMQGYIEHYSIPWYKCAVLQNAINPIEEHQKPNEGIRIIYHTTPHRGLNILYSVFDKLCEKHDDIELDVYSSFKIYGWEQRDEPYKPLFDACKEHPKINYHGSVSNAEVREALKKSHVFAYPSIWKETSCLALIEAMSAGLMCVHPNYAALPETAANWTWMYQYQNTERDHAQVFYGMLDAAIHSLKNGDSTNRLYNQKQYIDMFYNWELRATQWKYLLASMV